MAQRRWAADEHVASVAETEAGAQWKKPPQMNAERMDERRSFPANSPLLNTRVDRSSGASVLGSSAFICGRFHSLLGDDPLVMILARTVHG
jgi:hypothetical protein